MSQRLHTNEILNEIMRIFKVELGTALSLKSIIKGELNWLPPESIPNLVNGIWIYPAGNIAIDRVTLPRGLTVTYNFRVVFVRRIGVNENVNERKMADVSTIVEKAIDFFDLPNLTLTNGQVLWAMPVSVEMEPLEDLFVNQVSADLIATAFNIQCSVRTNHR